MTATEFQTNHGPQLKEVINSPWGQQFFAVLNSLRPSYEFPVHEHLMIANREAIRGYELCLKTIVALSMPPKVVAEVEANYGVPDRKPTAQTKE